MKYVLSERAARWVERKMAEDRSYKPATGAPSRLVRRDMAGGTKGEPAYHFKYSHTQSTSGGQTTHTVTIGEGAVQIGGYTYFSAGGTATTVTSGTCYLCAVVALASGTVTFKGYATTAALNTAQADMTKYIFPLYKLVDYAVDVDYRPMPNAGCWEIAESVSNGGGNA